ncbi:rhodanese-like domain-containing protein [Streptococcus dysgalactiae]|uniref:rhodanese-like domain-containing protein n=1 Tax=Streptococcus dysgalactiae TaxID=1334 RepID=UPI001CF55E76|nr:rhodanese-like domain-containing protein [Streptococcus dysgalactiae]MCB2832584.1 rhodanese-like domain-containing protein [Streptococcus dysgalactiae subsp. dysgalactiae]MCB2840358.1 rhodanese-like domain-containing protein [Streptococcus dysgalactiae subsp. dysgalactiae]MCB2844179.1 rhodanese-like domain-containing protein [Streptococcus dysgalactiae subsp. dysgalactiae]
MIRTESISALKAARQKYNVALIDVREADEYTSGHVPGAINMPLSSFVNHYQELGNDKEYHVICQSGARSAQAVAFLENKGYSAVSVEGGTQSWDEALTF